MTDQLPQTWVGSSTKQISRAGERGAACAVIECRGCSWRGQRGRRGGRASWAFRGREVVFLLWVPSIGGDASDADTRAGPYRVTRETASREGRCMFLSLRVRLWAERWYKHRSPRPLPHQRTPLATSALLYHQRCSPPSSARWASCSWPCCTPQPHRRCPSPQTWPSAAAANAPRPTRVAAGSGKTEDTQRATHPPSTLLPATTGAGGTRAAEAAGVFPSSTFLRHGGTLVLTSVQSKSR